MHVLYIVVEGEEKIFGCFIGGKDVAEVGTYTDIPCTAFDILEKSAKACHAVDVFALILVNAGESKYFAVIRNPASGIYRWCKHLIKSRRTVPQR